MVQCPDCEEKDRIVIAGKVFCANCGTPWQPGGIKPSPEVKEEAKPVSSVLPVAKVPQQPTHNIPLVTQPNPSKVEIPLPQKATVPPPPPPVKPPVNPVHHQAAPIPPKPVTPISKPIVQPKSGIATPAKATQTSNMQKIDNLNDKLETFKNIDQAVIASHKKNDRIVKEIAEKLAQKTTRELASNLPVPDDNKPLVPIIPHSPIGDIETRRSDVSGDTQESVAKEPAKKSPNTIDDRALIESAVIEAVKPIPSERISRVVEEVASGKKSIEPNSKPVASGTVNISQPPEQAKHLERRDFQITVPSRQQRLEKAAAVPQSELVNKFRTTAPQAQAIETKASDTPKTEVTSSPPLASPATKTVPTKNNGPASTTFSDLASSTPIQSAEPIKIDSRPQTAPKPTDNPMPMPAASSPVATTKPVSLPAAQSAKEALDDLAKIIETSTAKPVSSKQTTPAQPGSQVQPKSDVADTQGVSPSQASVKDTKELEPAKINALDAATAPSPTAAGTQAKESHENIGSEIASLDVDDEPIFSDEEFKQLESTKVVSKPGTGSVDTINQKPQSQAEPGKPQGSIALKPAQPSPQPTPASSPSGGLRSLDIIPTKPTAQPAPANQTSNAPKASTPFVLPTSPDGITPGAAYKPSHQINYPVVEPPKEEVDFENKPLTEEEALKLVHERAAEKSKTPPAKIGHSFTASSALLSVVGLVLVGVYVWQVNYPNLAFKVAAGKAGINASMPGYIPSGWQLGSNIKTSPGLVSYSLKSDNNKRKIDVVTTKTDWDSQALAENYVTPKSSKYLALQAQGLTIYMYGNNQASWVNNGNWYRLEGNQHGLTQDQIIKIATSL